MLNIRRLPAVVVGGGEVGLRKARSLAEAQAQVRLVAEKLLAESCPPNVALIPRPYQAELLEGAKLVFACTGDRTLNARIADDARRLGAWVNVADQPDESDFFTPAVACDGDVVVAVGTGGSAPALAGNLRDRIASTLPERIGEFAAALQEAREKLKHRISNVEHRKRIMRRLAKETTYEAFREGGIQAIHELLEGLMRDI